MLVEKEKFQGEKRRLRFNDSFIFTRMHSERRKELLHGKFCLDTRKHSSPSENQRSG